MVEWTANTAAHDQATAALKDLTADKDPTGESATNMIGTLINVGQTMPPDICVSVIVEHGDHHAAAVLANPDGAPVVTITHFGDPTRRYPAATDVHVLPSLDGYGVLCA